MYLFCAIHHRFTTHIGLCQNRPTSNHLLTLHSLDKTTVRSFFFNKCLIYCHSANNKKSHCTLIEYSHCLGFVIYAFPTETNSVFNIHRHSHSKYITMKAKRPLQLCNTSTAGFKKLKKRKLCSCEVFSVRRRAIEEFYISK